MCNPIEKNKRILVSFIVPIYNGEQYYERMISQIQAAKLNSDAQVELIFVNDNPCKTIEICTENDDITIHTMETDINTGIQGARVRGLAYASGEYVVFLDQDDKIEKNYLLTQLCAIGNADFVVCQGYDEEKLIYKDISDMKCKITYESIREKGNFIVSPGQVLIRKDVIPKVWKENILENNGADDWLLWLLIFNATRKVALNYNAVYCHVVHGHNFSFNREKMFLSVNEVRDIVKATKLFSDKEIADINKTIDTMVRGWLADADRIRVRSNIYSIWLEELVSGENKIANLIKSNYGTSVALYGCGEIGKKLFSYFNHNEIRVKYFIDTQKQGNIENIPIVPLVDNLPEVNIVIVTLTIEEKEVMEKLKNYGVNNVISVRELFLYC